MNRCETGSTVFCRSCQKEFKVFEVLQESLIELDKGVQYLHPMGDCDEVKNGN